MEIHTPTERTELLNTFGENDYGDEAENADQIHPLGEMPPRVRERLDELAKLAPDVKVTLARDWERAIFAMVEGHDRFDVLAFTEDGRVGHGGINLPHYFDTFAELSEHDRLWSIAHAVCQQGIRTTVPEVESILSSRENEGALANWNPKAVAAILKEADSR